MLVAWCEERRGYRVVYIGDSSSTMKETIEHHHGHDTQGIREIHARIEGQRSHGWCGSTMGAPAPLCLPPAWNFVQVHVHTW